MSLAKITAVTKSMKPNTCEKCKTDLPKGSAYRWYSVGFRSKHKHIRCMESACTPRDSERESSLLSEVYAARENAEDQIANASDSDELKTIVEEYAEAVREVASQYEEAMTSDSGTVFNTTAEERYEALDSAADDIDSAGGDIDDARMECTVCEGEGEVPCDDCNGTGKPTEADDAPDCPTCSGTGKVECDEEDCEDGQIPDIDAMRDTATEAIETDLGL